jgi:hypothetical protein
MMKALIATIAKDKIEAILVTGRGGPKVCRMAVRLSTIYRWPFTPRTIPDTHFCQRSRKLQGHSAFGKIRSNEKIQ